MFILYGLVAGLLVGWLAGGRLSRLARLEFRWAPLIVGGLIVQLALFSEPVSARIGSAGPAIYVATTAAVLLAVAGNVRITGVALVVAGAAANLAAIVANGGYMPASPAALAALSRGPAVGYSNSAVVKTPALEPLTDILAMPAWLPGANVFSVGDVLIALGVAVAIVAAMRRVLPAAPVRPRN